MTGDPSRLLDGARRFGPDGRGLEVLLLAGPVLVAVVAAVGRSVLKTALVAGYLLAFVADVLYRGVRSANAD